MAEYEPGPQEGEVKRLRGKLEEKEARIEELEAAQAEYEKQREEREQQKQKLLDDLEMILSSVRTQKAEMMEQNEEEMVDLCLRLTEKVLQHEVEQGRYKIGQIIDGALQKIRETSEVHVHVNPGDYDAASEALQLVTEQRDIDDLQVTKNPDIEPASCRIETETGTVVSDTEKRLEKIEQELLKQGNE
jgi:flagellar biosynthesis/type III secretory pathway protein FliH